LGFKTIKLPTIKKTGGIMEFFNNKNFIIEMENKRDKKELEEQFIKVLQAWNNKDIETIIDDYRNGIEFGYRSKELRNLTGTSRKDLETRVKLFF
jgi:hypothetical protein